jgi:hypothetical protein
MNIIGLGKAGCAIAEKFGEYPEYKIFQIDVDKQGTRCYNVKRRKRPRRIRGQHTFFQKMFSKTKGETLFVIGGSGDISAMSLRIIEQIKDKCDISSALYRTRQVAFK